MFLVVWLTAVLGYACTRVESSDPPPGVDLGEGGFTGAEGGSGSRAGEGGEGNGGASVSVGGAPGSIELGIWPTFAAEPSENEDVEAVLASIAALSAGSATLPVYERWDTLSGATGTPRAAAWARLDDMIEPYREREQGVALCIGLVDRSVRAWPVLEEVDSVASRLAIERTIHEAFTRYAAQLTHLCFGYEVDRYLAAVPEEEAAPLLELLGHAVAYAKTHPLWSPRIALGVAITLQAASDPDQLAKLALGHEVVAVYDPLDENAELRDPAGIAAELEAALAARPLDADGEPLPLTLLEAGYPSAEAVGSSEQTQRIYYESLFEALALHAGELGFVGLFGLGDRAPARCDLEAASFGDPLSPRAAARCSMGLRADTGESKSAWPSVLSALSRYR